MDIYIIVNLPGLQCAIARGAARRAFGDIARMNALEHQLDYVFADDLPDAGGVKEVAPGVL